MKGLPDFLAPELRLVFVGLNPGTTSARRQQYYAGPGNRFWPALSQSGILTRTVGPGDEAFLLECGIGLTDVVERSSDSIAELGAAEWREGAELLREKIARCAPRVVAFVGLRGARAVLGRDAVVGVSDQRLEGARVFVLPSTSGLNTRWTTAAIEAEFRALAKALIRP